MYAIRRAYALRLRCGRITRGLRAQLMRGLALAPLHVFVGSLVVGAQCALLQLLAQLGVERVVSIFHGALLALLFSAIVLEPLVVIFCG